jgi:ubiquinone/menaquinone biosynthesis C-methylase UbiE
MTFAESAEFYDEIYANKNYHAELEYLKNSFEKSEKKHFKFEKILEIGCGTGQFSKLIYEYCTNLTATDISPSMVEIAQEKLPQEIETKVASLKSLSTSEGEYDLIIMLFHVYSYLKPKEIKNLRNLIRNKLKEGGYVIFDFWERDAIRKKLPEITKKNIKLGDKIIERQTNTKFNRNLKNFKINIHYKNSDGTNFKEKHQMYSHLLPDVIAFFSNLEFIQDLDLVNRTSYQYENYGRTVIFKKKIEKIR